MYSETRSLEALISSHHLLPLNKQPARRTVESFSQVVRPSVARSAGGPVRRLAGGSIRHILLLLLLRSSSSNSTARKSFSSNQRKRRLETAFSLC